MRKKIRHFENSQKICYDFYKSLYCTYIS